MIDFFDCVRVEYISGIEMVSRLSLYIFLLGLQPEFEPFPFPHQFELSTTELTHV